MVVSWTGKELSVDVSDERVRATADFYMAPSRDSIDNTGRMVVNYLTHCRPDQIPGLIVSLADRLAGVLISLQGD